LSPATRRCACSPCPRCKDKERRHLELGVEGEPELVDQAMEEIRLEIEKRGINWVWRP
jgi:hypothetical protein